MTTRVRSSTIALRRVLENSSLLTFASLLVVSVAMQRYSGALVWAGALLVFFAHACDGRVVPPVPGRPPKTFARRMDALRAVGLVICAIGVALSF